MASHAQPRALRRPMMLLACGSILTALINAPHRWESDSMSVALGIDELYAWLIGRRSLPLNLGAFPPAQYLTGLAPTALRKLGVPVPIYGFWIALNILSFFAVAALLWRAAAKRGYPAAGMAAAVIVLGGPLIPYASGTFNEPFASLLVAGFVLCAASRGLLATSLLFIAAGLTKEVAAPLLLPLWIGAMWLPRQTRQCRKPVTVATMLACVVTVSAAHVAFNWLRYETWWNVNYFQSSLLVPEWSWRVEYFAALWIAPNGGLLVFWPVLLAWPISTLLGRRISSIDRSQLLPAGGAVATAIIVTAGLACWAVPFGWWCWGPRLLLPWIVGILTLLVCAYPGSLDALARRLLMDWRMFAASALIAAAAAVPHVAAGHDMAAIADFFRSAPIETLDQPNDPATQHQVVSFLAWRSRPLMLQIPLRALAQPQTAVLAGTYAFGLIALLYQARLLLIARPEYTT